MNDPSLTYRPKIEDFLKDVLQLWKQISQESIATSRPSLSQYFLQNYNPNHISFRNKFPLLGQKSLLTY